MSIHKSWVSRTTIVRAYQAERPVPPDLVSICLTNFNYARFLVNCLDSLAAQTHPNLDLVIIDDCSTQDDSVAVADRWLAENERRFYRVTLLVQQRNQGPSGARNTAFRHALGTSVFVIDADNDVYPHAIARLHAALSDGKFDAVYSQLEIFGDRKGIGRADIWDPIELARENYVDVMALIRHDAWARVDGYTHIEEGWEDYDFWLKFADEKLEVGYLPEILCRYRVHGKSRTAIEAHAAHEQLKLIMAFRHPLLQRDLETAGSSSPRSHR